MDYRYKTCVNCKQFIYLVQDNRVIKYNLLTKRKYIICYFKFTIRQLYVSDTNLIVGLGSSRNIYWNGQKIDYFGFFRFLKIHGSEYIANYGSCLVNCNNEINNADIKMKYFDSSSVGEKIVYCTNNQLFEQSTSEISIWQFYIKNIKLIKTIEPHFLWLRWIPESNCIFINYDTIFNLDNHREIAVRTLVYKFFVFNLHNLVICLHNGYMELYDIDIMDFVQRIDTELKFIDYNKMLNVVVTDELDCYRFQKSLDQYVLHKINLGLNYILDHNIVPQNIKIIMEIQGTILNCLPDEICYIELYQQLLLFIE